MKRIILFVMLMGFIIPLNAQKKLSLDEAISIALQRNTSLIKSKNSLEGNESQLKNAYGSLLPTLGARAEWNWQRVDDVGGMQRNYLGELTDTPPSKSENRNYSLGIGGGVTLFDGLANYANISQKKDNLQAAEYNFEKLKQNVVYNTTDLYYQVLNANELKNVREENVKYYQKFYETVQERNRLGSIALADVYTAQVQLGNAELLLIQTQNIAETTLGNLLNYLGLNALEEYTLVDPYKNQSTIDTDSYMKDFDNIQTMVNWALNNRLDFKGQELFVNAAQSGLTIARSGLMPSLSGSYSWGTSAITTDKLFDRKVINVGLSLQLPIFSNWSTENQIQFALINLRNAQEDLLALERQIQVEIKQGFLDLNAAKKSLDVASKNVIAADENRKINQERYNLGSGTILDVLQADRDHTDALRSKINALYDFYTKLDRLNNSLGKLDYKKFE